MGIPMLRSMLNRGVVPWEGAEDLTRKTINALPDAVPIDIDNVARFLRDKGDFDPERDCPNLAPPFPLFWVEYDELQQRDDSWRVGILFKSYELDPETASDQVNAYFRTVADGAAQDATGEPIERVVDVPKWLMVGFIFLASGGRVIGPVKHWSSAINPDGRLSATASGRLANLSVYVGVDDPGVAMLVGLTNLMPPAFMAISFMHCKNVARVDNLPNRQERREMQRREEAITIYKTLQIEPMKQVLSSQGGVAHNGLKKALHICRGHFSTYSEEKPLFGKYAGRFWIQAHVRGTAEAGKVIKDYKVKPPRNVA